MKTLKQIIEEYNTPPEEFLAVHYSHLPNLSHLIGSMYGRGIKGEEEQRLVGADARIRRRVYFYPKHQTDAYPQPEGGLGGHVYSATLKNILDSAKYNKAVALTQSNYIKAGHHSQNAYEMALLDHGYSGYRTHNLAVVLNSDVPVKYEGTILDKRFIPMSFENAPKKEKISIFDTIPDKNDMHQGELLSGDHITFYYKNLSKIKEVAPSATLQYGRLNVHAKDADALKDYLSKTTTLEF